MKKSLLSLSIAGGMLALLSANTASAQWGLTGNAGTNSNVNYIGTTDLVNLNIRTNGVNRLTITSDGKVGIGNAGPVYKLDIRDTATTSFRIMSSVNGSSNLILARALSTTNCMVNYNTGNTALWRTGCQNNDNFMLFNSGTGTSALTVVKTNNYVGIGTTPLTQLDVAGLNNWDLSTTPGDMRVGNATNNIRMGVALAGGGAGFATIAATNSLQLGTGSTLPNLNTLNINGGKVGIGTTTPAYKLHVAGANPSIVIEETGTSNSNLIFNRAGVSKWYLLENFGTPADNIAFYDGSTSTKAFQINQGGNVGIGTDASANRLYVNGDAASTNSTLYSRVNYVASNSDVKAIEGYSHVADNWGIGVQGTGGYSGVRAIGEGGASTSIGVFASASGTGGTQYGVYAGASGGTDNWGGFFYTKTYASELRVGGTQGATGYVAAINGKLIATEVRVDLQGAWPDYVFNKDHNLMPIDELEASINANQHLPGVPSACDMENSGIMLGEMQTKTMEKVEELTLYLIQLKKENDALKNRIEVLEKK